MIRLFSLDATEPNKQLIDRLIKETMPFEHLFVLNI